MSRSYFSIAFLPSPYILLILITIYFIYLYHLINLPIDISMIARTTIYIIVSASCILLIPQVVSRRTFLRSVGYLAPAVVVIGLPTFFIGSYSILFLSFDIYPGTYYVPIFNQRLHQYMSLMSNPNPMGELVMFGLLAIFADRNNRLRRYFVLLICVIGLYLVNSQAAILGAGFGTGVYIVWRSSWRRFLKPLISVGIGVGTVIYLIILQIIPGPEFLTSLDLTHRVPIWRGAVGAVRDSLWLGHGPQQMEQIMDPYVDRPLGAAIYNSFLRVFVTAGVIGGVAYILLFLHSLLKYPIDDQQMETGVIYAMFIAFIINEMFSGNAIFGLSFTSVVGSLLLGYTTKRIRQETGIYNLYARIQQFWVSNTKSGNSDLPF